MYFFEKINSNADFWNKKTAFNGQKLYLLLIIRYSNINYKIKDKS